MPDPIALLSVVYGSDTGWFWTFATDCRLAGQQANRKIIENQRESRGRVQQWVKPLSELRPVWMKLCVCFSFLSFYAYL